MFSTGHGLNWLVNLNCGSNYLVSMKYIQPVATWCQKHPYNIWTNMVIYQYFMFKLAWFQFKIRVPQRFTSDIFPRRRRSRFPRVWPARRPSTRFWLVDVGSLKKKKYWFNLIIRTFQVGDFWVRLRTFILICLVCIQLSSGHSCCWSSLKESRSIPDFNDELHFSVVSSWGICKKCCCGRNEQKRERFLLHTIAMDASMDDVPHSIAILHSTIAQYVCMYVIY